MHEFLTAADPMTKRRRRGRGMSLVEVLVVTGIIALLVALVMPAVQNAREAARRTACRNNLHQIGIALQNYHDMHQVFPPGSISRDGSIYGAPRMPPVAGLLPHLEQANLYNQLVFNSETWIFKDPRNESVVRQHIPLFRCPSDSNGDSTKDYSIFFRQVERPARFPNALTNYGGIYGRLQRDVVTGIPDGSGSPASGSTGPGWIFGVNRSAKLADVTDGSSNTLIFAEVLTGTPDDVRGSLWTANAGHGCVLTELGPNSPDPDVLFRFLGKLCNPAARNDEFRVPCVEGDDVDPDSSNTSTSRSRHPGGVHVLAADGSVHFLSDHIAISVWRNLGSMNDGATTTWE